MEAIRHRAMCEAYRYRKPAVIVLDLLQGLRVFCESHADYLNCEYQCYYPIETIYPDGVRESAIG
jgi:hypothetical protein